MAPLNLFGLTRKQLLAAVRERNYPEYRGAQIFRWIYLHGMSDFSSMTDLPLSLRQQLDASCRIRRPGLASRSPSRDGTVKFLFTFEDGLRVEGVSIPESHPSKTARQTFCLSTQVGCPLKCTFCYSGTIPLVRNLSAGEMVGQYVEMRSRLALNRVNLVFMGMGEPLLNSRNLLDCLDVLTDSQGLAVPPRRITVSTAGLAEELARFMDEAPPVQIALSLHATTNSYRDRVMPINRKYPLEALIEVTRQLPLPHRRRVTFEYVLLQGENDSVEDARRLTALLRGVRAKVNVIEYNPWPGSPHRRSSAEDTERFLAILRDSGLPTSLRRSRGDDVLAACGQLAGNTPGVAGELVGGST